MMKATLHHLGLTLAASFMTLMLAFQPADLYAQDRPGRGGGGGGQQRERRERQAPSRTTNTNNSNRGQRPGAPSRPGNGGGNNHNRPGNGGGNNHNRPGNGGGNQGNNRTPQRNPQIRPGDNRTQKSKDKADKVQQQRPTHSFGERPGNQGGGNNNGGGQRPGNGGGNNHGSWNQGGNHGGGNNHGSWNQGGNHGGANRPGNRPGNGNGNWGNGGGNHRPGNGNHWGNGNHRPGNGGGNHWGNNGGGNHGHHHPGGSWTPPPPPPPRPHRPAMRPWRPPVPPASWRPVRRGPSFATVLGVALGTALYNSVNALINEGYYVDGYQDGMVYLRDLNQYNYFWPDATLRYDNGLLVGSEYMYSTPIYDLSRYSGLYNYFYGMYGMPAITTPPGSAQLTATWFGPGQCYITLQYSPMTIGGALRYCTVLSQGRY